MTRHIFRNRYGFSLLILVLITCQRTNAQHTAEKEFNSWIELKKSFYAPSQHFGSAPLWVWNTSIDSAEIRRMLRQFKSNAFGGVFIHPRAGLITPYLSPKWLALYRFAVQEAKKIGLDIWIYDENSYPSGFAGGLVPEQMPASYNQGEMLEYSKADTLPARTDSFYIILKKTSDGFDNITGKLNAEKNKAGEFILFKKTLYYQSPWYGGFSYVDLMAKHVTEKFIDLTMSPYEKVIGNEFGKTVRGVFSDEPNIEVQYPKSIRWTPDLFRAFKEKWGYDLETQLACLVEETGDWKKVRHNYYQTLLQLFINRWSKPYSEYTSKHNLEWTGHYWEHEWPSPNHGPDNMAMYAWPQRPGIDMLFNQFDENNVNAQFGNIRSVKELASVANQLDKKRTLSETYGGGGWELRFNDMKRLGDWEFALGINTLNQHLSFMSIAGARKYDYPQSFSYHEPWWPYYKYLNQYFARLSMALASGQQINNILIIEPTTTAWMYFDYDKPDTVFKILGNQFQQFVTRLEKAQVEYDLGSENIIKDHGKTDSAIFTIGSRTYKTVILPPGIENLDMPTFRLLEKYAASGGQVIQFSKIKTLDGSSSPLLEKFYDRHYPGLIVQDSVDDSVISSFVRNAEFSIRSTGGQGDLYHYRRTLQDGQMIFLTNASLTNAVSGEIAVQGKRLLMPDLFTGKIFAYPAERNQNELKAVFNIPPAGSLLLFAASDPISGYPAFEHPAPGEKTIDAPLQVIRKTDNSLSIDFCDLEIGDTVIRDAHVYDAADRAFKFHGFSDGNPWNTSVQFRDETIRRNHFSASSGFRVMYYFNVEDGVHLSSLKAVVENPQLYKIELNGHIMLPSPGKWWIDRSFKIFDIGRYVHPGKNTLTVTARPMSVYAEIEPVYILGDFSLSPAKKGWNIVPPQPLKTGSWKNQGMPMFGQEITYRKQFVIPHKDNHPIFIELGNWKGTVATVKVNNRLAGIITGLPYSLNISSFLQNGQNTVDVNVIGSLKNVFGPFHNKPEPGMVSPWHWRYVSHYPPGDEYDVYDYGLYEDFKILSR